MERNFNEIYEKIYKDYNVALNILRKKEIFKIVIRIIVFCITIIVSFTTIEKLIINNNYDAVFLLFAIIILCVFFYIMLKTDSKYKLIFKSKVMDKMIKMYSNKLSYYPNGGISTKQYNISGFDTTYDWFSSEDCIMGTIGKSSKLKMAQVTTISRCETSKGTSDTTTFAGLFGIVNLESPVFAKIDILINANAIENFFRKVKIKFEYIEPPPYLSIHEKEKLEVDSSEFEKYYDFYTNDGIMALRIFTADLIEKFVEIRNKDRSYLEMRIERDVLYFRYWCGDIFEPVRLKNALDFDVIYHYFNAVDIPISLIETFLEHIKHIE